MIRLNMGILLPLCCMLALLCITSFAALESFNQNRAVLIKNGTVATEFNIQTETDVLIRDEIIVAVGKDIPIQDDYYVIDATGKIVMPGAIDPHTHISMPFMGTQTVDDWYYASKAGLAGGTTMLFDFILPVDNSLTRGVEQWRGRAKAQGPFIDYSYHVAVTGIYDGQNKIHPMNKTLDTLAEMTHIAESEGITSFKFFLAYKNALMIGDSDFLISLQHCSKIGANALVHAENGDAVADGIARQLENGCHEPKCHLASRPAMLEAEATNRAAILAQFLDAALYVVHVQSKGAVDAIQRVRASGYKRVVGEAVVSGFTLDERDMHTDDFDRAASLVMSPPFHIPEVDGVRIMDALAEEEDLQTIGTDHATFTRAQKRCLPNVNCTQERPQSFEKIPNGVNGIEERVVMTYTKLLDTGLVDLSKFVRLTSTNAAKIFGVYPQKGSFSIGSDADIIILDPSITWNIDQTKQNIHPEVMNVFHGMEAKSKVVTTLSRGQVLYDNQTFAPGVEKLATMPVEQRAIASGRGKFIGRKTHSSILYKDAEKYRNNGVVSVDENGMLRVKHDDENTIQNTNRRDEL